MAVLKRWDCSVGRVRIARLFDSSLLGETAQELFPEFDRKAIEPDEHWLSPVHLDLESGHVPLPVQTFVLEALEKIVLIDTGIGNHKDRPLLPEMHRLTTRYLARFAELGLKLEDVNYVLCTHIHPDHVGWNTRLIDGAWVPTFPNATYMIPRLEFEVQRRDASTTPFVAARNTFVDSIEPLIKSGQVELVDAGHKILDLLTYRPAPGHTAGHMKIELRSEADCAVFAGDVIHSPLQIPFWHWSSKFCADGRMARETRHALLEFCVAENALLIPAHFRQPFMARVRYVDGRFTPLF